MYSEDKGPLYGYVRGVVEYDTTPFDEPEVDNALNILHQMYCEYGFPEYELHEWRAWEP